MLDFWNGNTPESSSGVPGVFKNATANSHFYGKIVAHEPSWLLLSSSINNLGLCPYLGFAFDIGNLHTRFQKSAIEAISRSLSLNDTPQQLLTPEVSGYHAMALT